MFHFAQANPAIPGQPHTWGEGSFDFETYSEAGFIWNDALGKWLKPPGASTQNRGLGIVGANAYTEHPSAEVLTLTYRLPPVWFDVHGRLRTGGVRTRWRPGLPPPTDLFDYLAAGGVIKAFNVMFERLVWANICVPKYGWPSLEPHVYQLRCTMAKARVNSFPGKLANLGEVLDLVVKKDAEGKRLLDKFSMPRNPTKKDPRTRVIPPELANPNTGDINHLLAKPADAFEFAALQAYCDTDTETEDEADAHPRMEPMTEAELLFWWIDQEINWRGVAIDRKGVQDCIAVLEQALERYGDECRAITGFNPGQLAELRGWLAARGVHMDSMDEEAVEDMLKRLPPAPPIPGGDPRRRVLEIRQLIGSASVKKLYAMENQACRDNRLRNLIVHHGARTGRPTGEGPQPLNLPKAGPDLKWCGVVSKAERRPGCGRPFKPEWGTCPWCGVPASGLQKSKWSAAGVDHVLEVMATRSLDAVEAIFGDALLAISGCIRGLFEAGPNMELMASDFSAIEAVVTAMLAKCQWRIDVFRQKRDIYLMSASKITGTPVEVYEAYLAEHGDNHPDRQKIGKVAELALGFMGWIGAWRQFDDTETFTDEEVKQNILAWRDASPEIVELAGGQTRRRPKWQGGDYAERFGFEGAAVNAIEYPGQVFEVAGVKFYLKTWAKGDVVRDDDGDEVGGDYSLIRSDTALKVRLLSGRELTYHNPRLVAPTREWSKPWEKAIVYMTWNTNPKYGRMGWVPMSTYAGRLIENIVQAIAHDILRHSIINLRAAGYHTVLHVYDEIVAQVPPGCGSLEEFERIMATMPWWAQGWPIRASGGWRGRRYRKG
jgi:DNA polymerase